MALALPAVIGLFSVLQYAVKTSDGRWVRLAAHTYAFLQDFFWLSKDVGSSPMEIGETVPDSSPVTHSACVASGLGLGGVCHSVAIKIITIHVIEVVISITTIITYLHNYI
jgi:hypothetical protein